MSELANFLMRNSVAEAGGLPLVQTVAALSLLKISDENRITAQECDVFIKERLNYFFVGRPAYKLPSKSEDPPEWELPCCFIFEYDSIDPITRVFPFDSGAHQLGLYPSYINMMDKLEFEVSSVQNAPQRIIGAFFGSAENYFKLQPKDHGAFEREYSLSVKDPYIKAAHRLASHTSPRGFDDRRFTIEIQSQGDVDLSLTKPLAVVLPTVYLDDTDIRKRIEVDWGAEPIDYPIGSLSVASYYALIYAEILKFYQRKKFL